MDELENLKTQFPRIFWNFRSYQLLLIKATASHLLEDKANNLCHGTTDFIQNLPPPLF